jgi:hypothetical protein
MHSHFAPEVKKPRWQNLGSGRSNPVKREVNELSLASFGCNITILCLCLKVD